MNTKIIRLPLILSVIFSLHACTMWSKEDNDDLRETDLSVLPLEIRRFAEKETKGKKITEVGIEKFLWTSTYTVKYFEGSQEWETEYAQDGHIISHHKE